jgi:ParB family chromosome partitioning protein
VQISTAYGKQQEGSKVLPRNQYTAIRDGKPKTKEESKRPEFKVCKFTTDAVIAEGNDIGTVHKICANPNCPVHHPKQTSNRDDAQLKAEQEKQRRDQAIANTTGLRVLSAIAAAVPVRLLKRDLFFVLEMVGVLEEPRIERAPKKLCSSSSTLATLSSSKPRTSYLLGTILRPGAKSSAPKPPTTAAKAKRATLVTR